MSEKKLLNYYLDGDAFRQEESIDVNKYSSTYALPILKKKSLMSAIYPQSTIEEPGYLGFYFATFYKLLPSTCPKLLEGHFLLQIIC